MSLPLPSGIMVHLPVALRTDVWVSLHAHQTLHPQQGGLTPSPVYCDFFFFHRCRRCQTRDTDCLKNFSADKKIIPLIWQHRQSCRYVRVDLWRPGHTRAHTKKACGGSSSGHDHGIMCDLSLELPLPHSKVRPTISSWPSPGEFKEVVTVERRRPASRTPPESRNIVQQGTVKCSHVVTCFQNITIPAER